MLPSTALSECGACQCPLLKLGQEAALWCQEIGLLPPWHGFICPEEFMTWGALQSVGSLSPLVVQPAPAVHKWARVHLVLGAARCYVSLLQVQGCGGLCLAPITVKCVCVYGGGGGVYGVYL